MRPNRKRKKLHPLISGNKEKKPQLPSQPVNKPSVERIYPAEVYQDNQEYTLPGLPPPMSAALGGLMGQIFGAIGSINDHFNNAFAGLSVTTKIDLELIDGRVISTTISSKGKTDTNQLIQQVLSEHAPGYGLQQVVSSRVVTIGDPGSPLPPVIF